MLRLLALVVVLTVPQLAFAQLVPERELEIAKAQFDAGSYREALKRAEDAMAVANFTDAQRVELHRLAALSAFNIGDAERAQQHFLQMLQLNPDVVLDPFAVPPPAMKVFEQVKRENADALSLIRQQLALRAEQEKRAAVEAEKARLAEEERRRKVEELNRTVTVRVVERRSPLVNFVPFGVPQFVQGRTLPGVAFSVSQGVFALTSVVSYFVLSSLYQEKTIILTDRITSDGTGVFPFTIRAVPAESAALAAVLRLTIISSDIALLVAWAGGVIDAWLHHEPEVVTQTQERAVAPAKSEAPPMLNLFLTPGGGVGAGVSLKF